MIKIQALKEEPSKPKSGREAYEPEERKKSRAPLFFLIALTGFFVYLKSFLTSGTEAASESARDEARAKDRESSGAPVDEKLPPLGSSGSEEPEGSSDNVVQMPPRLKIPGDSIASFLASDAPPLDFPRTNSVMPNDRGQPSNDNQSSGPPPVSVKPGEPGPGKGGGGGGDSGSSGDPGGPRPPGPGTNEPGNRAPRLSGAVRLPDLVGCSTYFIPVLALLAGATDADGDQLKPILVSASSGKLEAAEGGGWFYTPEDGLLGEVTLRFHVSDGIEAVEQVAYFSVVEAPSIVGSDLDDNLLGTQCGELIDGRGGDDNIDAGGGRDTVIGGSGDDHIVAGRGDDVVHGGDGNDIVFAGEGNDIVFGGRGNDRLFGEDGNDTIYGGEGDDLIAGGKGDDILFGDAGADVIAGDAGDDTLDGGDGDDSLDGGTGNDVLLAGAGDDHALGGDGDDVVSDGSGADIVEGGDGDDHVVASADGESDRYDGGAGEDTLDYSSATLSVFVDVGQSIGDSAEFGRDAVSGFEKIIGGAGDDHLVAGNSSITLEGGQGDDTFEFRRRDDDHRPDSVRKITDFTVGDRIVAARFEIRHRDDDDDGDDEIEDLFDSIYLSEDRDDRPIRFRFEKDDDDDRTFVDVRDDDDSPDYYSIELNGHHRLEFAVVVS